MLGACLIAALALGAAAAVPASAGPCQLYGTSCETEKEHAEFVAFTDCPFGVAEANLCSWVHSTYKETWPSTKKREEWEAERGRPVPGLLSEFKAGNVTVALKVPIVLQGGINAEGETDVWFGAEGAPTIEPAAEAAAPLTKDVEVSKLSPSELARYNYYVKIDKETKVTATVELAGPPSAIGVNINGLLAEEGTAFSFPVKVKLSNPFLGSSCYVGSESDPIDVAFTTGKSGELQGKNGGRIAFDKNGYIISIVNSTLVADEFASPGVEGCGVAGGADEAVDASLGLPSPSGHNQAILNGTLKVALARQAKEGLEGKI